MNSVVSGCPLAEPFALRQARRRAFLALNKKSSISENFFPSLSTLRLPRRERRSQRQPVRLDEPHQNLRMILPISHIKWKRPRHGSTYSNLAVGLGSVFLHLFAERILRYVSPSPYTLCIVKKKIFFF
jgi:hypothetical protein